MNTHNINRMNRLIRPEQGTYRSERGKADVARSKAKDRVSISAEAQELLKLREALVESEVRPERVEALREAIARGAYDVPAKAIAAKMLGVEGELGS